MLPPFIIEQIRKRESENARPEIRPSVEVPRVPPTKPRPREEAEEAERGVVVIDL